VKNNHLKKYSLITLIFCLLVNTNLFSQEVLVSENFNMRNDYAYEILGHIGENILMYRDRGYAKKLVALDTTMQMKWEKDLQFEKENINVYGLIPQDTSFIAFYGFKEKKNEYLKAGLFDENGVRLDTTDILEEEKGFLRENIEVKFSENKKKTLLYYTSGNNKIKFIVFDNDTLGVSWKDEFIVDEVNLYRDLVDVLISDLGEVFCLFEKYNNKFRIKDHVAEVMAILNEGRNAEIITIPMKGKISQSMVFSLDTKQQKIGVFGLYHDKKLDISQGYAFSILDIHSIFVTPWDFSYHPFDKDLTYDLSGGDKEDELKHVRIKDVVWRQDQGFLMFIEEQRSFSRRQNYTQGRSNSNFGSFRGWTDYFNEDIGVISVHPDGNEHWNRVLYKKQFSQDDGAVFSSFFIFKTPSRLRLLYNDEIKNDNTVSEYILGPTGKSKRSSLLSTEYQDLRLRFNDALQDSNMELYVPSEKNQQLSIVKISY